MTHFYIDVFSSSRASIETNFAEAKKSYGNSIGKQKEINDDKLITKPRRTNEMMYHRRRLRYPTIGRASNGDDIILDLVYIGLSATKCTSSSDHWILLLPAQSLFYPTSMYHIYVGHTSRHRVINRLAASTVYTYKGV